MGHAECTACPVGTASNTTGGVNEAACLDCEAGTFSDTDGASECTAAPPGSYTTSQTEIVLCPVNTFNSQSSANAINACIPCPVGTHTIGPGAQNETECIPCPAGTHSSPSDPGCQPCAPGSYTSSEEEAQTETCRPCAPQTFADHSGATTCAACSDSTYTSLGWSRCIPCDSATDICLPSRNGLECSGHGVCEYGSCVCEPDWTGPTCAQEICEGLSTGCIENAIGVTFFSDISSSVFENDSFAVVSVRRESGTFGALQVFIDLDSGVEPSAASLWGASEPILVEFAHGIDQVNVPIPLVDDNDISGCRILPLILQGSSVSVQAEDVTLDLAIEDNEHDAVILNEVRTAFRSSYHPLTSSYS